MKVVTKKQMKKIESFAIDNFGIPAIILMENAAAQVAAHCMSYLDSIKEPKVVIVAGAGNNGGDGLAVARHLFTKNIDVGIICVGDMTRAKSEALINLNMVEKLCIPIQYVPMGDNLLDIPYTIETCDLVVDALIGIGLHGELDDTHEFMIDMINKYAKYVISVDVPSGINSDTGHVLGNAVCANKTVTFAFPKRGLLLYPGANYAGEVTVVDITIPKTVLDGVDIEVDMLVEGEIRTMLPMRQKRSNKGTHGRICMIGGSAEMPGAAVLSSSAAYRAGGGLVVACVSHSVASVIHNTTSEVVTKILPDKNGFLYKKSYEVIAEYINKSNVVILGPGLGRSLYTTDFVREVLLHCNVPLVLDADALYAVASYVDILKGLSEPCIVTPHLGEMSKLTGLSVNEIINNMVGVATDFSKKYDVITVLKDARTVVASPTGYAYINITGSPSLAKAGSGDVLTGIIAAFIAQGVESCTSARIAAYIHGKAGERAAEDLSVYGVNASDLLNYIPMVMNDCD